MDWVLTHQLCHRSWRTGSSLNSLIVPDWSVIGTAKGVVWMEQTPRIPSTLNFTFCTKTLNIMMHLGVIYLFFSKINFQAKIWATTLCSASHRATNAGFCTHSHKKHQICPTLSASTSDLFAKVKVLGCERSLARKPSCRKSHTVSRDRWTGRDKRTHPLTPPWRVAGATVGRHSASELLHQANAPVSITRMYNLWDRICLRIAKYANDERPLLSC